MSHQVTAVEWAPPVVLQAWTFEPWVAVPIGLAAADLARHAAAAVAPWAARPDPEDMGGPTPRTAGPGAARARARPPCRGLGGVRRQYLGLAHAWALRTRAGLRELALRAARLLPGYGSRLLVAGGATVAEPGGRAAWGHRPLPG